MFDWILFCWAVLFQLFWRLFTFLLLFCPIFFVFLFNCFVLYVIEEVVRFYWFFQLVYRFIWWFDFLRLGGLVEFSFQIFSVCTNLLKGVFCKLFLWSWLLNTWRYNGRIWCSFRQWFRNERMIMMQGLLFFLILFHQRLMFLVIHSYDTLDPTSIIKLRIPSFNVLVNYLSVLL